MIRTPLACMFLACATGMAQAQSFDCVIEPMALVDVVAADTGRIADVSVRRGDVVKAGDVLVKLDSALQQLQVDLASVQAQSDIQERATQRRLALRAKEYDRVRTLQDRNVAAQTLVDEAEIEMALTELTLEEAALGRKLASIQLEQARTLLDRRTIRAPVDGLILTVEAHPGEYAHEQFALLTLARIDPLHVEAFLPAELFSQIAVGDSLPVIQSPPFEARHTATVISVDRVFDPASGTFGVLLALENPDGEIPAGTRCLLEAGGS